MTSESSTTAGQPARTVVYTHAPDSLLSSIAYPAGNAVSIIHNARNLTSGIALDGQTLATYEYNAAGLPTAKRLENGLSALYVYDSARRLTGIEHRKGFDMVAQLGYTLDKMGNRRSKTTSGIESLVEQYAYDPVDQLTQALYQSSGSQRTVAYNYDPVGNRQLVTDAGQSTAYSSNSDNAYTSIGGQTTATDANGNMLTVPGATYTYDAQNRLTAAIVNGTTTTLAYDPRNRVAVRSNGTQTLHLTYGGWNLLEERDGAGAVQQIYIHGAKIDELLAKVTADGPAYYHADALGSTIALTGETGEVLETYRYDAFGTVSVYDSSGIHVPVSGFGNRFTFTGREWIAEANLYDYRNRVYSPTLGRFLQTDPIRFAAGDVNIYRYVANNPVNLMDPTGEFRFYGNWGGPNWVNGQERAESDPHPIPKQGDPTYQPPIDRLDALYEKHDRDLWAAHNLSQDPCESDEDYTSRKQSLKEKADADLSEGVKNLPAQWKLYNSFIPVSVTYHLFRWGPHRHGY